MNKIILLLYLGFYNSLQAQICIDFNSYVNKTEKAIAKEDFQNALDLIATIERQFGKPSKPKVLALKVETLIALNNIDFAMKELNILVNIMDSKYGLNEGDKVIVKKVNEYVLQINDYKLEEKKNYLGYGKCGMIECYNTVPEFAYKNDNELEVKNDITNLDVVVSLIKIKDTIAEYNARIRFIKRGTAVKIRNLPIGKYKVKIALGTDYIKKVDNGLYFWKFNSHKSYYILKDEIIFEKDNHHLIDLENVEAMTISEKDFNTLNKI